jgi:hypothetical protein
MIHIDYKVTTWERFSIDEEHKEALEEFLKENPEADATDIFNWAADEGLEDPYCDNIDGSEEILFPKDNGGQPTLEITIHNQIIHHNGSEP